MHFTLDQTGVFSSGSLSIYKAHEKTSMELCTNQAKFTKSEKIFAFYKASPQRNIFPNFLLSLPKYFFLLYRQGKHTFMFSFSDTVFSGFQIFFINTFMASEKRKMAKSSVIFHDSLITYIVIS